MSRCIHVLCRFASLRWYSWVLPGTGYCSLRFCCSPLYCSLVVTRVEAAGSRVREPGAAWMCGVSATQCLHPRRARWLPGSKRWQGSGRRPSSCEDPPLQKTSRRSLLGPLRGHPLRLAVQPVRAARDPAVPTRMRVSRNALRLPPSPRHGTVHRPLPGWTIGALPARSSFRLSPLAASPSETTSAPAVSPNCPQVARPFSKVAESAESGLNPGLRAPRVRKWDKPGCCRPMCDAGVTLRGD